MKKELYGEYNYDNDKTSDYGVEVTFQPTASDNEDFDEENLDAEAFDVGVNTFPEHFDEDEDFEVKHGYTAWYVIGDDCFTLRPGTYRFHDGRMQVNIHGKWERYRHDAEDY